MGKPTQTTLRRLFSASGGTCSFPGCDQASFDADNHQLAEAAHICADKPGGPRYDPDQSEAERQGFENLIVLCRTHHRQIDVAPETYPVAFLRAIKASNEAQSASAGPALASRRPSRSTTVTGTIGPTVVESPHAVVGHVVNVRTTKASAKIQAPAGTIGADARASRYVTYLIKRYNEFASKEPTRTRKFSYGAISKAIEVRFDGPWRLLPLVKLEPVCAYLHARIDKTRMAKSNKSKGYASYRVFDDFA